MTRRAYRTYIIFAVLSAVAAVCLLGCAAPFATGPKRSVEEHYEQAASYEEKAKAAADQKDLDERDRLNALAIQEYTAITRQAGRSKESLPAYLAIVRIYEYKEDYNKAIDNTRKLLKAFPTDPDHGTWEADYQRLRKLRDRKNSSAYSYQVLDALVKMTGRNREFSYAFAIILLTVVIKLALTPLTSLQFKAMKDQARVAPVIKRLQEEYKDDRQLLNQKIMEAYKEHNVNLMAGCLPLMAQLPVLWLMYRAIYSYEYQFSFGAFLWVRDLSVPDVALLALYAVSMFLTQKFMVLDPAQAKQQQMMTIFMTVLFVYWFWMYQWPAAFILYWLTLNILSTWQQLHLIRKHGVREIWRENAEMEKRYKEKAERKRLRQEAKVASANPGEESEIEPDEDEDVQDPEGADRIQPKRHVPRPQQKHRPKKGKKRK
jgi:YidC/Oxa1 family membrane protein insertase